MSDLSTQKHSEAIFHLFFLKWYQEDAVCIDSDCFNPVNFVSIACSIKSIFSSLFKLEGFWKSPEDLFECGLYLRDRGNILHLTSGWKTKEIDLYDEMKLGSTWNTARQQMKTKIFSF